MTWTMISCSAMTHPHPIKRMTVLKKVFVLIISGLLIGVIAGHAQSLVDEELAGLFYRNDTVSYDHASLLREADNDISVIVSVAFICYKTFISSQDNPSCVFTPSCSEYAVEAFQKYGFIVGWLKTFDRLSRCHGLVNPQHYPFDIEKKHYYDPVQ